MRHISKQRSCPNCSEPVGWARLWFDTWPWSKWPCPNCATELEYDRKRQNQVRVFGLFALAPALVCAIAGIWWPVAPLVFLYFYICSFLSVRVRSGPGQRDSVGAHQEP